MQEGPLFSLLSSLWCTQKAPLFFTMQFFDLEPSAHCVAVVNGQTSAYQLRLPHIHWRWVHPNRCDEATSIIRPISANGRSSVGRRLMAKNSHNWSLRERQAQADLIRFGDSTRRVIKSPDTADHNSSSGWRQVETQLGPDKIATRRLEIGALMGKIKGHSEYEIQSTKKP